MQLYLIMNDLDRSHITTNLFFLWLFTFPLIFCFFICMEMILQLIEQWRSLTLILSWEHSLFCFMLCRSDPSYQRIILQLQSLYFLSLHSFALYCHLCVFFICFTLFFQFFGSIYIMSILTMQFVDLLYVIFGLLFEITQQLTDAVLMLWFLLKINCFCEMWTWFIASSLVLFWVHFDFKFTIAVIKFLQLVFVLTNFFVVLMLLLIHLAFIFHLLFAQLLLCLNMLSI